MLRRRKRTIGRGDGIKEKEDWKQENEFKRMAGDRMEVDGGAEEEKIL